MSDITEHPDPSELTVAERAQLVLDGRSLEASKGLGLETWESLTRWLLVGLLADLSRLREERDALTEISGVEYCTVHDGIQIEGNSDDCDQADTNPDDECRMVALLHVAPSPDPNGGEQ